MENNEEVELLHLNFFGSTMCVGITSELGRLAKDGELANCVECWNVEKRVSADGP